MTARRADASRGRGRCGGAALVVRLVGELVAGLVLVETLAAGCTLVADPPKARYACRVDAPACPDGEVCIVGNGDDGVCGVVSVCIVDGGDGIARPADDGAACPAPEGATKPYVCAGGACVELDCSTPGRPVVCGDGCRDPGEACDDANDDNGDGCARDCTVEAGWKCTGAPSSCATVCGDRVVTADEACDDGNDNPVDGCDETCRLTTFASTTLVAGSVDGVDAATIPLDLPLGMTADADGVLYVADSRHHRVLRIDPRAPAGDGNAIVVAGVGTAGFSGDGGPALQAEFCLPAAVAMDTFGNLYVADTLNHRVRRIDRNGIVTTIAGSTAPGEECSFVTGSADDDSAKAASQALFDRPLGVATDPRSGAVYVLDTGNLRVRRLDPQGPRAAPTSWRVRTVVGAGGVPRLAFDPLNFRDDRAESLTSATQAAFSNGDNLVPGINLGPLGLAVARDGGLIVADTFNARTLSVSPACLDGSVTGCRVVGAPLGFLSLPFGVHVLADGSVAVSDVLGSQVFVDGRSAITTRTAITDDGAAAPALNAPCGLTSVGDALYLVDANENRVLRRQGGAVDVAAGLPGIHIVDGQPADDVEFASPAQIALDGGGGLYVIEGLRHVVRRFAPGPSGALVASRVAGVGRVDMFALLSGSQFPNDALFASFVPQTPARAARPSSGGCVANARDLLTLAGSDSAGPEGVAVLDRPGPGGVRHSVFVADTLAQQVLRFDDDGTVCDVVSAVAVDGPGTGSPFQPTFLRLVGDTLVVVDTAFGSAGRIVRVTLDAAGNRVGPPTTTTLFLHDDNGASTTGIESIADVLPLPDGSLLVADPAASVVWKVTSVGDVAPHVGVRVQPGDDAGDVARSAARLFSPLGLALCPDGRVVIADGGAVDRDDVGVRLRAVSADGTRVTRLAGTGQRGFSGDFGPASAARLTLSRPVVRRGTYLAPPVGVACAADGTVYVADREAQRVRRVAPDGTITTVAGRTAPPGPGPGAAARLYAPTTFAVGLPDAPTPALFVVDGGADDDGGRPDGAGRVVVVDGGALPVARLAAGYPRAAFAAPGPAARAPLLVGARGAAWDAERRRLVITQSGATSLRVVTAPSDDPATWIDQPPVDVGQAGLAGIARDPADDSFVVVDEDDDCVRRLSADLVLDDEPVLGDCASAGAELAAPSSLAFAATGTLYVADTGHDRVVRFDADGDPRLSVVVGNGEPASAGEGSPAAEQAVHAPRQLAFDAYDNLFVTSTTTVRVVLNDDGDDPDGDDHVVTAFGAGNGSYPERDAKCLTAVAPLPPGLAAPVGAEAAVVVGDSCLGAASLLYVRSAP